MHRLPNPGKTGNTSKTNNADNAGKKANTDKKASSKTVVSVEEIENPSLIRTIPIPEKLMDYLLPLYVEDAYILSGHKERFVEPRTMENRFKAVLEKS